MRTHILKITTLFALVTLGCSATSRPIASREALSPLVQSKAKEELQAYRTVDLVVWNVDSKTKVEARIETLDAPPRDGSPPLPSTRFKIKNIDTGGSIYEHNSGDRPVSMYTRDLNNDGSEELIITWGGGSADRLEIITVSAKQARIVLSESYRIDAALIDLSGKGNIDVLVSTGDSGAGPFYTTRYVWENDRYLPVGKVPYDVLMRSVEKQFASAQ
jgi:hypothetical protein